MISRTCGNFSFRKCGACFILREDAELGSVAVGLDAGTEIVPVTGVSTAPVAESAPSGGGFAEQEILFAVAVVIADSSDLPAGLIEGTDPAFGVGIAVLPGVHVAGGLLPDHDIVDTVTGEVADSGDGPVVFDCREGAGAPLADGAVDAPELVVLAVLDDQAVIIGADVWYFATGVAFVNVRPCTFKVSRYNV